MQKVPMRIDINMLRGLSQEPRKIYLNVPFDEKDEAKQYGAMFDWEVKKWFYTDESKAELFKKWQIDKPSFLTVDKLTDEQQRLITEAKKGHNILVDACIGSGKTSTVQVLCNEMKDKKILYLTYNRLLKFDAQEKIVQPNTEVTNYHGFAFQRLKEVGIEASVSELIQVYLSRRPRSRVRYDLMIIDEYQDIDTEIAQMLEIIKSSNPGIQIIVVGDMKQKIYDNVLRRVKEHQMSSAKVRSVDEIRAYGKQYYRGQYAYDYSYVYRCLYLPYPDSHGSHDGDIALECIHGLFRADAKEEG